MSHPLHEVIGRLIRKDLFSECEIIKDPACGGKQHIPLFCSGNRSRKTELCNVDLLITQEDKIKVIIEIEEANVKPTQICGKFLTSALSGCFIHESSKGLPVSMSDSVLFIQILDTTGLKPETSKIDQWENIEQLIRGIIPLKDKRKITHYELYYGEASEFESGKNEAKKLLNRIENFLGDKI